MKLKLLALIAAIAMVAVPTASFARGGMRSSSGYCKSGVHVGNVKNCKENGGKK